MCADDRGHPSVKIPTKSDFLGGSFGMKVDKDNFSLDLLQKFIDEPKRIVAGTHEHASLEIDDGVVCAILLSFIHSPTRHGRGKICRTQQSPRRTVRVAIRHLKIFDDLSFVPDVIAGSHHVDAKI